MSSSGEGWRGSQWDRVESCKRLCCRNCHIRKTREENMSPENLAWRSYLAELAELTGK